VYTHLYRGWSCFFSTHKEESVSRVTPLIVELAMSDYNDPLG
jgi:hypothetical protein